MANEPLPNQVPDIALPDLKKKKKEKKKSGVAWGNGGAGAEAFEGATGGIGRGAASSAAAAAEGAAEAGAEFAAEFGAEAAAEAAASEMGFVGRLVAQLAEMLGSTLAAQMVVGLGAAALLVSAAAVAAYMAGWLGHGAKGSGAVNLGGIADNLHLGRGDASGLDFAKGAGRGALRFEDGKAGQAAKGGEKAKDGEQAKDDGKGDNPPGGAPNDGNDNAFGERPDADRLAHNLSGAKLSTDLGGGSTTGGAFAKMDQGWSKSPNGFGKGPGADKGKSAALAKAAMHGSHVLNLGRRGIRANRALGQLRSMAPMGSAMTTAGTTEEAGQAATTQFEGAAPIGAAAPSTPAGLNGTTPNPNPTGGNPGSVCTSDDPKTCGYGDPGHVDMTQMLGQLVKQAQSQIDMAKNILLAMGIIVLVMEAIAAIWFPTCCSWVGAIFWAIAIAIAVAAVMIVKMMANMVHQQADAIRQAGQNLGTDGGKSPQAEEIAQAIDKMGDDIGSCSVTILLGGIGGFIGFAKVNSDQDALQKLADQIEAKGNQSGGR